MNQEIWNGSYGRTAQVRKRRGETELGCRKVQKGDIILGKIPK